MRSWKLSRDITNYVICAHPDSVMMQPVSVISDIRDSENSPSRRLSGFL